MVRNNIIALLLTFGLLVMTGCEKNEPEPEHLVALSFSTSAMSGLKSASSAEENLIEKVILFGVDDQGEIITNFSALTGTSLTNGTQLTISRKVKFIYAIANPSVAMETAALQNVSDLMNMTGNFAIAPQWPFLMSCVKEVNVFSNNVSINLEFVRAVAKIDVISKSDDFQITSVTLQNTPDKGYVFYREVGGNVSVPTSTMVTYSSTGAVLSFYVAESVKLNTIQLLVTGMFQGEPESFTYSLTSGGQKIDIIRNSYYQAGIVLE